MNAIEVNHLTKIYRLYRSPKDRIKEMFHFNGKKYHREFYALNDISFNIEKGQTVGIIGQNGSGKSTLLQMICGVLQPTNGSVKVNGRVAALLELGAGFNPEFTGRENVYMNGALMGLNRQEMDQRFPAIEDFAEIGEFIDQPVKVYSSGMFVRLAFAAAINVDPDILIIDEALAVGDVVFQHRCMRKIKDLQKNNISILFVSHDTGAIKTLCSSAMLIDQGKLICHSDPGSVVNIYHARVANSYRSEQVSLDHTEEFPTQAVSSNLLFKEDSSFDERVKLFRHGSGEVKIKNVEILDEKLDPIDSINFYQRILLRVHILYSQDVNFSILGFIFRDKNGTDVIGTNTFEENKSLPARKTGETLVVDFIQNIPLTPGTYSVTVALAYDDSLPRYFDWVDTATIIQVLPPKYKKIQSKVWVPVDIVIHS
ncbi:MAG: ABC transporter ATP-binding protein [Nitrospirae bacterium]|nr:ABC transporter ATP-binding protein [Candidatus Manganitrophaceae bacterium]